MSCLEALRSHQSPLFFGPKWGKPPLLQDPCKVLGSASDETEPLRFEMAAPLVEIPVDGGCAWAVLDGNQLGWDSIAGGFYHNFRPGGGGAVVGDR